ncbi:MAG: histidinol-phosphatase [Clostridia bacterium]|nr:histidinol-phosphatase [Clostridia bacterium]
MFTQSFHNHTWRCNHASGTEREYVENAVNHDMTMLGFSDHAPYVFEGGYYSSFRMKPDQLKGYFDTVLALKEEYRGRLKIHVGLEAEYYPKYFGEFLKLIDDYPVEYLLLGQHFTNNEIDGAPTGRPTDDIDALKGYVSQVSEAISTGRFACVAHPDVFNFTGDRDVYQTEMLKLCQCAKRYKVPLEINLLGMRDHRHYPNPAFWEVAGQTGNVVVCGSDAHSADVVWDGESFFRAMDMVRKYRLCWNAASIMLNGGHTLR